MKGTVEVFEFVGGGFNKLLSERNMIMEGAKESIVDILTFTPPPSALSSVELMAVSSFTIAAITMGSPSLNFKRHSSRYGLSLNHASGIQYLGISGEGSGIHSISKNLPNRLLNEFGGVDKPSPDQPRFDTPFMHMKGSEFQVDTFGNPSVDTVNDSITISTVVGQDYAVLEKEVSLRYGEDYTFVIRGKSDKPFQVAYLSRDFSKGGNRYLDPLTRKYTLDKKFSDISFNSQGIATYKVSPDYTPGSRTSIQAVQIIAPRLDLYDVGTVRIDSVDVFLPDRAILKNSGFTDISNWVNNSDFEEFAYSTDIPLEVAALNGIGSFQGWEILSNFSSTVALSSIGYVSKGIEGVTLQASSLVGSGAAHISQTMHIPSGANDTFFSTGQKFPFSPLGVITFDLLSDTAGAKGVNIHLQDITNGEYFSFSPDFLGDFGTWGSDTPLIVGDTSRGEWRTYSLNVPLDGRLQHQFEISIKADGTGSNMATYHLRRVTFGQVNGWNFGNDNLRLSDPEEGNGVYMTSNQTILEGAEYSSLTYVGQKFSGLNPSKAYSLVIDADPLDVSSMIGVSITHRHYGNISDSSKFNALSNAGIIDLTKSTSTSKRISVGYSTYLDIYNSAFAVTDPYSSNPNSIGYRPSQVAVEFDGSFQTSDRLFVALSQGTHNISLNTTNVSNNEVYSVGMFVRNTNSNGKDFYYDFDSKEWIPYLTTTNPILSFNSLRKNVVELENLDFSMVITELGVDLLTDNKYTLCLEFVSEVDGASPTLSFDTPLYIHESSITDSDHIITDPAFYNGAALESVAYYMGAGAWKGDSSVDKSKFSDTQVPPGSIIEVSAVKGEQDAIAIWGFGTVGSTCNSTYDIIVFPLSGEGLHIKKVSLCDMSLQGYNGPVDISDRDLITSEFNISRVPFIEGGWHFHTTETAFNDSSTPSFKITSVSGTDTIILKKETSNSISSIVSHTTRMEDVNLIGNVFKVSLDYFQDTPLNSNVRVGVLYKKESGNEMVWDFTDSKWKAYVGSTLQSSQINGLQDTTNFPYSPTNITAFNNYISTPIEKPIGSNNNDLLTTVVFVDQHGVSPEIAVTNLRYYSITSYIEASSIFPEFPNPEDTSVQPTSEGPGREGHFLNRIEFMGRHLDGNLNYEESLYDGCYPEGSGTTIFSGGSYVSSFGNLNKYGVITPNGYILEHKLSDRASQSILDSSAGMVISAISPVSSTQKVAYAITLSRDEWYVLNSQYGGIAGIGLWSLNFTETARKFGSNEGLGGPPFIVSGNPDTLSAPTGAGNPSTRKDATTNPPFLNGYALKIKSSTRTGLSLSHTSFGSPPGRVNLNGWCVAGDNYALIVDYKGTGDNLKIQSDNFSPVDLIGDNLWRRETITFNAANTGHNKIGFLLRAAKNPPDILKPELLVGSALLVNTTSSIVVDSYDFTGNDDLDKFSIKWRNANQVEPLGVVWDGDFYTSSLYNSSVLAEKEPVFRLFSKKAFFPGGLQINPSSDYITIVWTVDF